jgi:hypothetical protein
MTKHSMTAHGIKRTGLAFVAGEHLSLAPNETMTAKERRALAKMFAGPDPFEVAITPEPSEQGKEQAK